MEGEGGSLVPDPLVGEAGGGHDLDDVESGPGHVVEVEGSEVGELVYGVGFGVGVGGLDLSADLVEGLGNEGGLADELEAETFDEVLQIALKESLHNGRSAARHFLWRERTPQRAAVLLFKRFQFAIQPFLFVQIRRILGIQECARRGLEVGALLFHEF